MDSRQVLVVVRVHASLDINNRTFAVILLNARSISSLGIFEYYTATAFLYEMTLLYRETSQLCDSFFSRIILDDRFSCSVVSLR